MSKRRSEQRGKQLGEEPILTDLALQGGSSHGAFTLGRAGYTGAGIQTDI